MGEGGFEPPKSLTTDLQSAPDVYKRQVLRPVILDDNKLNAQAYERLASQVAGHAG